MTDSILNSTKKVLGISADYDAFDIDILMHINSVFSTLNQIGIGPEFGYSIVDATPVWEDYLGGDLRINSVKTYVACKVRLIFDPPTTSFALDALKEIVREHEWRLSTQREYVTWVPPVVTTPIYGESYYLDGWL